MEGMRGFVARHGDEGTVDGGQRLQGGADGDSRPSGEPGPDPSDEAQSLDTGGADEHGAEPAHAARLGSPPADDGTDDVAVRHLDPVGGAAADRT